METWDTSADVAIVGGGPAGAAAAIVCAMHGLKVALFEREGSGKESPGETLHPGIEPLFEQLGVAKQLPSVTGVRHAGIWIEWGSSRRFEAFGSDANGVWKGFQVHRAQFDAMLRKRAVELGVAFYPSSAVTAPVLLNDKVCGVETTQGQFSAGIIIDATGRSRWLARALHIDSPAYSQRLTARYGYVSGSLPSRNDAPLLVATSSDWVWTAMVRPHVYQWTRVALEGQRLDPHWKPPEFKSMTSLGASRGADVTWRLAKQTAGAGWFMVGDAAAMLDPSASHGVLKAIMSGMAAAHLAAAVLLKRAPAMDAALTYQEWMRDWFSTDVQQLTAFYRQLGHQFLFSLR